MKNNKLRVRAACYQVNDSELRGKEKKTTVFKDEKEFDLDRKRDDKVYRALKSDGADYQVD